MSSSKRPSHEAVTHCTQVLLCAGAVWPSHDAQRGPEAFPIPGKPKEGLSYICQRGKVGSLTCWVCLDGPEATEAKKKESLKELLISRAPWVEPPEPLVESTMGVLREEGEEGRRSKALSTWLCKTPLDRHGPLHLGVLVHPKSHGPASLLSSHPPPFLWSC